MLSVNAHELFDQSAAPVWLVTVESEGERAGLVCTTVMSASIIPTMPRVIVTLAKQHHTAGLVRSRGAFALSLLGQSQLDLALRFGIQSGHEVDKWGSLNVVETPDGHPVFPDVVGWVDCRVEACFDSGDRWIVLAECRTCYRADDVPTMTVADLVGGADSSQKAELKRLRQRDAERDANAIQAWKAAGAGGS